MRKRTEKEIKQVVENLEYSYIKSYLGNKNIVRVIIQDKRGYKYDVVIYSILRGQGINFVDKSNPFSLENISLWLKLNNSQFELVKDNEYINAFSKLNLYCNVCKDYPKMSWNNVLAGIACGVCKGFQVGKRHNLAAQRPDIAKEWHPAKNGSLTPQDVTHASHEKAWWLCPDGHEYFSRINSRTNLGNGCKVCSDERQESKIANRLKFYILSKYHAKEEYRIYKNPETNRWLPYDIYIPYGSNPELNGFYIEIHGEQHYKICTWHKLVANRNKTSPEEEFKYQKRKDRLKKNFAKKNGTYIEIDLRKIKIEQDAIEYIEKILEQTLL